MILGAQARPRRGRGASTRPGVGGAGAPPRFGAEDQKGGLALQPLLALAYTATPSVRRAKQRGLGRARGAGANVALAPENPRFFTLVDGRDGSVARVSNGGPFRERGSTVHTLRRTHQGQGGRLGWNCGVARGLLERLRRPLDEPVRDRSPTTASRSGWTEYVSYGSTLPDGRRWGL